MKITRLKVFDWRQFKKVDLKIHNRLTILTGANGAGKSTLLNIIDHHFGWNVPLVGTPRRDQKTGALKFLSGLWDKFWNSQVSLGDNSNGLVEIGEIAYEDGDVCKLSIPEEVGTTYQLSYSSPKSVVGLNIPSHRTIYRYQPVSNIPTTIISRQEAHNQYKNAKWNRYQGGGGNSEHFHIKEALISVVTFGYGNERMSKNHKSVELFEGFEEVLRKVLPPKLGFKEISVRVPEVVLKTDSGDFSLDAVSGGVASIIDLAWQLYMFESPEDGFVVTVDEPENHLHPEMQKTILPNFLHAFPKVQFIVATHNPFIITSVSDSNVYALNYDKNNRVNSVYLENVEKSGTANEILREVLGIDTTMPNWVDDQIDSIIEKYAQIGITAENVDAFKNDLNKVGLGKYVSTSVSQLVEKSKHYDSAK